MEGVSCVIKIAVNIFNLYSNNKENDEIVDILLDRLKILIDVLKKAENRPELTNSSVINSLNVTITRSKKFLEKRNTRNFFTSLININSDKATFQELRSQYQECFAMLSALINVNSSTPSIPSTFDISNYSDYYDKQLSDYRNNFIKRTQYNSHNTGEFSQIINEQMKFVDQKIRSIQNNQFFLRNDVQIPTDIPIIDYCDLIFEERIEEDLNSIVYSGLYLEKEVTIKVIKGCSAEDLNDKYYREARYLINSYGNNVVGCYGICIEPEHECLILEKMKLTLDNLINNLEIPLSFLRCLHFSYQIANGIKVIHEQKVAHRSLKPKNILMSNDYICYLSDFECANSFTTLNPVSLQKKESPYTPPEFKNDPYSKATVGDIYSYGKILALLFTRKPIENFDDPNYFKNIKDDKIKLLINKCCSPNPENRPSISYILENLSSSIGDMRYLYQLGLDHEDFKQYIEAIECYRQSIELGYGRSAYRAGMIYTTVQGLVDYSIALPYLLKAHELGSRDEGKVCYNLAILYEKCLGTSKNKNLSIFKFVDLCNYN